MVFISDNVFLNFESKWLSCCFSTRKDENKNPRCCWCSAMVPMGSYLTTYGVGGSSLSEDGSSIAKTEFLFLCTAVAIFVNIKSKLTQCCYIQSLNHQLPNIDPWLSKYSLWWQLQWVYSWVKGAYVIHINHSKELYSEYTTLDLGQQKFAVRHTPQRRRWGVYLTTKLWPRSRVVWFAISLVPTPLVHTVCVYTIYFSIINLMQLPRLYTIWLAEYYLSTTFQAWQYHFFKNYTQTES